MGIRNKVGKVLLLVLFLLLLFGCPGQQSDLNKLEELKHEVALLKLNYDFLQNRIKDINSRITKQDFKLRYDTRI